MGCPRHTASEILPYQVFDPQQRGDQVLKRVGDAEAEITFSVFAERGTGKAGGAGAVEEGPAKAAKAGGR
ncbi:MAG: hypothetical protein WBW85_18270 [Terriglobales bacterium]